MSSDRITVEEVRRLREAATPGPWEWRRFGLYRKHDDCRREERVSDITRATFNTTGDAALVAAAPALASLVLEQAEEIERLRAVVEVAREVRRGCWRCSAYARPCEDCGASVEPIDALAAALAALDKETT